MSDFILSCCSTADLTKEHFNRRNINYICFSFELDGVRYPDDLGESMPFEKFYKAMEDGANTKTSQVNVQEFEEYFEGFLKEGKDIINRLMAAPELEGGMELGRALVEAGITACMGHSNATFAEVEEALL